MNTLKPLEAPLRSLHRDQRVYVQRLGLVFVYPAALLDDIANDRYVGAAHDLWYVPPYAHRAGAAVAERLDEGTDERLPLFRTVWRSHGGPPNTFDLWWESVDDEASPLELGAAAAVAATHVMHWSLFAHRYEIDTSGQSL